MQGRATSANISIKRKLPLHTLACLFSCAVVGIDIGFGLGAAWPAETRLGDQATGFRAAAPARRQPHGHLEAAAAAVNMLRLRGGLDLVPAGSMVVRSPRDSMSLARRWQNAIKFNAQGYPNLTWSEHDRRLMHDEVVGENFHCRPLEAVDDSFAMGS